LNLQRDTYTLCNVPHSKPEEEINYSI
jgi:hypothetical protein